MTLLDAAYALDELAAGRTPDRERLLAGAPVAATLAADTVSSHMLGEGVAAGPRRSSSDHIAV